jgi:hypothetical protein
VIASQPTGVNEEEKANLAIAIHLKKTKRVDYKYREQDPHEWRYFEAWKILHNTSKYRQPQAGVVRGRDSEWNIVSFENNVSEEGNNNNGEGSSTNDDIIADNEAFNINKRASRGKAKGQKATKHAKILKERSSRKEHELQKLNIISERRLETQEKSNQIMGIRTLLQYSTDEVEKAQLLQDLKSILNRPPNPIVRENNSTTTSSVEVFSHGEDSDENDDGQTEFVVSIDNN